MNKKLVFDDFDDIVEVIILKMFGVCSINIFLKVFEVCGYYIVVFMCVMYFKVEIVMCI